ncbi:MAG: two-component sensor histidine kinase, partial [Mesorhizobium sp.]
MAETGAGQDSRGQAWAARLRGNRWLLAAGVVAVIAVYSFAGASIYVLVPALALLAAA